MKVLLLLFFLATPALVSAHFLAMSGDIGAVLHTNPDDDPIAGLPTVFYIDIKQRSSAFDLANCDCSVILSQGNTSLYSQALTLPSFTYTLPAKGVYGFDLKGSPIKGALFKPFTLHWDIRADRTSSVSIAALQPEWLTWLLQHGLHLLPIVAASLYVVYRTATDKQKDY